MLPARNVTVDRDGWPVVVLPVLEGDESLDALLGDGLGLRSGLHVVLRHGQGDLSGDALVVAELDGVQTLLDAAEALEVVQGRAIGAVGEGEVHLEGLALGVGSREKPYLPENFRLERHELLERTGSTQLSS